MLKKQKVVLFYPKYDGPPLGAPVCLLALASTLLADGFDFLGLPKHFGAGGNQYMLPVMRIDVGGHQATHGCSKGSVESINKDGFEDSPFQDDVLLSAS